MTIALRPMTATEYDVWRRHAVRAYAQEFVASGAMPPADAINRAEKDFAELLPAGCQTPDHEIWTAFSADEAVGQVWVKFMPERSPMHGFVYSLDVDESKQRRGHGRAIMEAVIETCRDRGVAFLGLHVFGHNEAARRLYDSLGFEVVSTNMQLKL